MSKNDAVTRPRNTQAAEDPGAGAVRDQIIDAADRRIRQYGYNKTTMTEIASDCSMSAANLYRYFKNKADLVSVLAQDCLAARLDHMDEVFQSPGLTTAQRIEKWIIESVEQTYREWDEIPHMSQLVADVTEGSVQVVHQQHYELRNRVLALIKAGIEKGEVAALDEQEQFIQASAIVSASAMFYVPYFMNTGDIDAHRVSAQRVAALINRALAP